MSSRAFASLVLATCAAALVAAQQPAPPAGSRPQATFRADVNYVEVDVHVTDEQGMPVDGLTKEDFEILEDGKPQEIAIFSPIEARIEPAVPLSAPEPDVQSNRRAFDGRLYLFVLDDLHTSITRTPAVKRAVKQFIERHFGGTDLGAIVSTSGRIESTQEVTGNRRLLMEAVDRFQGKKLRSALLERIDDYNRRRERGASIEDGMGRSRIDDPLEFERGYQARTALETVKAAADWLAGVQDRRKALILVGEGIDYDIYDVFNARYATDIVDDARDAIAAATRSNVNIYAVDPRGLDVFGDEVTELTAVVDDPQLQLGTEGLLSEIRLAQDSLRTLADQTGGLAFVNSNDFAGAFERIVRDNTHYYVLGYRSTNDRRDGKFRKLEVKVRKPGLRVRTRQGYVAARDSRPEARVTEARGDTSPAVREVLNSPIPVSGLTLTTTAAAFRGADGKASVLAAVQVDGRQIKFEERNGVFNGRFELSLVAVDHKGKVAAADRHLAELKLRPETHAIVSKVGFRLLPRLDIPPGRYQLRLAAQESGGGTTGSVFYDLEVPDFANQPLAMSGVLISSRNASIMPVAKADEAFKDALPLGPTAERDFVTSDTLWVYGEIYRGVGATGTVEVTTSLVSESGSVPFRSAEELPPSVFETASRAYGFRQEMPLTDVPPGAYQLRVEARSRTSEGQSIVREIPLRVFPTRAAGGGAARMP